MEQVKIENLNGSPYSGARYLYNDLQDDSRRETVDLLQMVPDNDRQNNNNNTTTTVQVPEHVNRVQCQTDNNIYPERTTQPYYSQSSHDHEQYSHLCQKHARQMENKSNTLCERQPGYYKDEDPYYSRVPNTYGKTMDKTDTGTIYFNYLKQFKRSQNRSTQSLPAVTYTLNKSNNKYIFKKPNLFKKQNVTNNYSTGSISKTGEYPRKDNGYSGIKRLLIIVCILVGVVLALGGIIIGFVVVPGKQKNTGDQCGEESIYCPELGCIPVSTVCTDPDFVCPGYTAMAVCGLPSINESNPHSDQDQQTEAQEPEVRLPSVTSHLIYDESNWVHYINSSGGESMYRVIDRVMTYTTAQEECRKYHGHLAHITHIREQVFIEDYLRDLFSLLPELQRSRGVWLGARRQQGSNSVNCMVHKQWEWRDPYLRKYGIIDGFSAFGPGKPDDFYNPEECLYVSTKVERVHNDNTGFLKWDDAPCDMDGIGIRPLCEVEVNVYTSYPDNYT